MYLCSCRGVTDRAIRAAIACGAQTPEEIGERSGAGTKCGGCWPALVQLLREAKPPRTDQETFERSVSAA